MKRFFTEMEPVWVGRHTTPPLMRQLRRRGVFSASSVFLLIIFLALSTTHVNASDVHPDCVVFYVDADAKGEMIELCAGPGRWSYQKFFETKEISGSMFYQISSFRCGSNVGRVKLEQKGRLNKKGRGREKFFDTVSCLPGKTVNLNSTLEDRHLGAALFPTVAAQAVEKKQSDEYCVEFFSDRDANGDTEKICGDQGFWLREGFGASGRIRRLKFKISSFRCGKSIERVGLEYRPQLVGYDDDGAPNYDYRSDIINCVAHKTINLDPKIDNKHISAGLYPFASDKAAAKQKLDAEERRKAKHQAARKRIRKQKEIAAQEAERKRDWRWSEDHDDIPSDTAGGRQVTLSAKNVETGAYCRSNVPKSKWNYYAAPYGSILCCCHGGVDAPTIKKSGSTQKCVCPEVSNARTSACISGFQGAGVCSECPQTKKKTWASAVAGWAGTAELMVYCCAGCKTAPSLKRRGVLTGATPPECSCSR